MGARSGHSARHAVVIAVLLLLVGAIATLLAWLSAPRVALDGRRELIVERDRIDLVAGFDGRTEIEPWNDVTGANADRDEIGVLMPRSGVLRWRLDAGPGRFVARISRRQLGPTDDRSVALVTVRDADHPEVEWSVHVPPVAENPRSGADAVREGPSVELALDVPHAVQALELVSESPRGFPDGSVILLLSPRYEQTPRTVRLEDHPLVFEEVTDYLMPLVVADAEERSVRMATRRPLRPDGTSGGGEDAWEPVTAPLWEATGSFTGPRGQGRPALVLVADPEARAVASAFLEADTVLRGAVALHDLMPDGASCELQVFVDGARVASLPVTSTAWQEIELPLGAWATGVDAHALEFRATEARLERTEVAREDVDLALGIFVWNEYRPERVLVGLSNPRLERPASVARREQSTRRPTVIVCQIETLRADVLGTYRRDDETGLFGAALKGLTPRLDALAEQSLVWETAISPSPWTLPSTASHLTGLLPSAHGVVDHNRNVVPGDVRTLAERARADGVVTGAFVANDILRGEAGFARGFVDYIELPYANARQVNAQARAWLQVHAGQQGLLFLHYFDPHHPFNAPGELRTAFVSPDLAGRDAGNAPNRLNDRLRKGESIPLDDPDVRILRDRYLGEIAWLDQQIGALVDAIEASGRADETVLVFTADHGEEFMEHGLHGHGSQVYDESVHVPLMVWAPGGQLGPPRRIEGVTSTTGLFATVLDLLGVVGQWVARPGLLENEGRNLFAFTETDKGVILDGKGDPLRAAVRAVRTDTYLLISHEVPSAGELVFEDRFYDLRKDPGATRPLPLKGAVYEGLQAYRRQALEWSHSNRARPLSPGMDAAQLEVLRKLGYVDVQAPGGAPPKAPGTAPAKKP